MPTGHYVDKRKAVLLAGLRAYVQSVRGNLDEIEALLNEMERR
jgi:hypothetical protein